jgi:hypothetical protein
MPLLFQFPFNIILPNVEHSSQILSNVRWIVQRGRNSEDRRHIHIDGENFSLPIYDCAAPAFDGYGLLMLTIRFRRQLSGMQDLQKK